MADFNNETNNKIISGTSGDDNLNISLSDVIIMTYDGNDFIRNMNLQPIDSISTGENVTIIGGYGDDTIQNSGGENSSINGDDGNDDIRNLGKNVTISGGDGDDTIDNWASGECTSINGDKGNDYIVSEGRYVTIIGGKGNDTILNGSREFDGTIYLILNCGLNTLFKYNSGDGNDIIYGFNDTSTLQIGEGTGTYAKETIGDDIIVTVGDGKITLVGAASLSAVNIDGVEKSNPLSIIGTDSADNIKETVDGATIQALGGNDTIRSYGDDVLIDSGAGNDSIRNYGDNVSINAGKGNDIIRNYGDDVTITGGTGNDTIRNAFGENVLFKYSSGDGNDVITGFNESSTLKIGDGTATYSTVKSGNNIIVTAGSGKLTLQGAATLDTLNILGKDSSVLTLTNSSKAAVTLSITYKSANASKRTAAIKITGNSLDNSIVGSSKNDTLYGKDGNDYLNGGNGVDKLYGGNGADTLWGGAGNDSLWGNDGKDLFVYSAGNDVIADYAAGDVISLGAAISKTSISGSDATFTIGSNTLKVKNGKGKEIAFIDADGTERTIIGGAYLADDNTKSAATLASWREVADATARTAGIKITGNALANTILGGSGKDTLYGKDGNDYLSGSAGVDKIYGGNGDDTLIGGAGNDSLWGNDGADTFIYNSGDGKDVISGFANDDMLQITDTFSASVNAAGNVIFTVGTGSITLKKFTAETFNVNGDTYKISSNKFVKK